MGAVQRSGIDDDVVMHVGLVNVRRHNELVLSFRESPGQFITHTVCFLRGDLAGIE